MAVHQIGLAVPNLGLPRIEPCSAIVAPETRCGGNPTSLYQRVCGVIGHDRNVWLCPVHAALAACGMAICSECAARGGSTPVILLRLTEPIRI